MIKKYWFLCFCVLVALASCEQERDPCLQPTTVPLRVRTMRPLTDTTATDSLLPHAIWVTIDSLDSIKFAKNVSQFPILLSPVADSARYSLQPDTAVFTRDTLTFYYGRKLQFLSNACGFTYFYSLQQIRTTRHNIDSVRLNNADVNSNVNTPEHVQIFF